MTLREAIKESTGFLAEESDGVEDPAIDAIKLGIESLKRLGELRRHKLHDPGWRLPGETEE